MYTMVQVQYENVCMLVQVLYENVCILVLVLYMRMYVNHGPGTV